MPSQSSGQDTSLSRWGPEFDSPWWYQKKHPLFGCFFSPSKIRAKKRIQADLLFFFSSTIVTNITAIWFEFLRLKVKTRFLIVFFTSRFLFESLSQKDRQRCDYKCQRFVREPEPILVRFSVVAAKKLGLRLSFLMSNLLKFDHHDTKCLS